MQFSINTLAALALIPAVRFALAQHEAAPSPTNSYGCEPHGDHWHCEGAITPTAAPVVTSTPSPAAITTSTSVAVVVTTSSAPITSSSAPAEEHDHDHEEHEDEHTDHPSGTGSISPSPTNSVGCEPHGDHWHCDGPKTVVTSVAPTRVISNTTSAPTGSSTTSIQSLLPTGGAAMVGAGVVGGFLGLVGAFAL